MPLEYEKVSSGTIAGTLSISQIAASFQPVTGTHRRSTKKVPAITR